MIYFCNILNVAQQNVCFDKKNTGNIHNQQKFDTNSQIQLSVQTVISSN